MSSKGFTAVIILSDAVDMAYHLYVMGVVVHSQYVSLLLLVLTLCHCLSGVGVSRRGSQLGCWLIWHASQALTSCLFFG